MPGFEVIGQEEVNEVNSIFKKGSKTISIGTNVKIQINMIKYEKQNFNCIGSLKI